MAVTFQSATTSEVATSGAQLQWTHSVSGPHPAVIVVVTGGITISGVPSGAWGRYNEFNAQCTYGGVPMTLLGGEEANDDTRVGFVVFALLNPPPGPQTITFTRSTSVAQMCGICLSYTDVGFIGKGSNFYGNSSTVVANVAIAGIANEIILRLWLSLTTNAHFSDPTLTTRAAVTYSSASEEARMLVGERGSSGMFCAERSAGNIDFAGTTLWVKSHSEGYELTPPNWTGYTTAGSFTYTIPSWAEKVDIVAIGGGGGGGGGAIWGAGGGGHAGSWSTPVTIERGVHFPASGTTTITGTVGAGGAAQLTGGATVVNIPGIGTVTASGGDPGTNQNNGPPGNNAPNITYNNRLFLGGRGGGTGSRSTHPLPGSGGGGGAGGVGPYPGVAGRDGGVYFVAYSSAYQRFADAAPLSILATWAADTARFKPIEATLTVTVNRPGQISRATFAAANLGVTSAPITGPHLAANAQGHLFVDGILTTTGFRYANVATTLAINADTTGSATEYGVADTALGVTVNRPAGASQGHLAQSQGAVTVNRPAVASRGQFIGTALDTLAGIDASVTRNRPITGHVMVNAFLNADFHRLAPASTTTLPVLADLVASATSGPIADADLEVLATMQATAQYGAVAAASLEVEHLSIAGGSVDYAAGAELDVEANFWTITSQLREIVVVPPDYRDVVVESDDRRVVVADDSRIADVVADVRLAAVDGGDRSAHVVGESRSVEVDSDLRYALVPAEDNTATV